MISALAALALTAATPPLPEFRFREHSSGATYDVSALTKGSGCRDTEIGRRCVSETFVSGWRMDMMFTIANQHLYTLELFGHRNAIPDMLGALKERYGLPCKSGSETVNNRAGGSFQSAIFTWCFRTGELVFRERDYQIDRFSVIYTDRANAPQSARITPDF